MILDETSKCITDISEKVFFCYINKSYNRTIDENASETTVFDIDVERDIEKIRDCACTAWEIADIRHPHIEYVFAIYHSRVVGVFKVKGKLIHRTELSEENYKFPVHPPKRNLEKQYSFALKNCKTEEQAKDTLDKSNDGLSFKDFSENILEGQKFEEWQDTYFFNFDKEAKIPKHLTDFLDKKLLFPVYKLIDYRKIYQNEHYNFNEDGKIKELYD